MRKLFLIMMTLTALSWTVMAQNRTYSGTVVDAENNDPLIGATVMPIGGGQGSATDIDGKFTLSVPANVKQVKVSYVGYKEQVVPVSANMLVQLSSTSTNLNDVVVVAYGTANKESLTGSVAVVGSKEIEDRPVSSVTAALEGNAPGVRVNNSVSRPGSSPDIRIRGFNSFMSGAQSPLYVVDGIVFQGDISDINPADIESMSVLKDAASCALYGNRGANGVILINTKRAKNVGKVDVTVQVRQGMYQRGLPFYDTLGAEDWMGAAFNAYINGQVSGGAVYNDTMGNFDIQKAYDKNAVGFVSNFLKNTNVFDRPAADLFVVYDEAGNPMTNPDGSTMYSGTLQAKRLPGYTDLDWWKAVSRTGYRQEYNLNAAGATEKFNAFASIGYLKEQGYMLATDFERFNGRLVANYNPTSYLKLGTNLAASHQKSEMGPISDGESLGYTTNPFLVLYNPPIQPYYEHEEDGTIVRDEDGKPVWNTTGLNRGDNVAWNLRLNKNNYKSTQFNGMIYGTAVIPYGFELTLRGNMMQQMASNFDYSNNVIGSQKGVGGLDVTQDYIRSYTFMQTLNWAQDYGINHVDVLLDHENYEYGYEETFLRKSGQLMPDSYTVGNFEENDFSSQYNGKVRTESYLGRARYNYDQKYFAEASIRRDGTSRFAKENRWGTFWSVGASWIISKEKFMAPTQSWLDYLKLRFAYGSVGNDAAANYYAYMALYGSTTYDKYGAIIPTTFAAHNLKWEATKTLDVAVEASFFDNRFTVGVDFYDKRNDDLLFPIVAPWSSGNTGNSGAHASTLTNIGSLQNIGCELQFGVDIIRNKNLKWSFNLDASFVKNRIKSLPDGLDVPGQALFKGKAIYEHYTYVWAGVDKATGNSLYEMCPDSPDYWVYGDDGKTIDPEKTAQAYEAVVASAKKSGHYFEYNGKAYTDRTAYARRKICGSALPVVDGSFGTNLSWKGINVNFLFTYSLGGKSYNGNYQRLMSFGQNAGALHKDIQKAWSGAPADLEPRTVLEDGTIMINRGEIDKNGVPVADMTLTNYNDASSSRFLISNDYLVFKNLNISYDLPKKWTDAMKMQGLNVGFSIDNVFIATAQKGFNPQYSFSGGQGASYVPARVFSFQISAKF